MIILRIKVAYPTKFSRIHKDQSSVGLIVDRNDRYVVLKSKKMSVLAIVTRERTLCVH